MDPTAALAELRTLTAPEPYGDGTRMVELIDGLDSWLTAGGFLPEQWARPSIERGCAAIEEAGDSERFTCTEAEAICSMLRDVLGHARAEAWMKDHIEVDRASAGHRPRSTT